VARSAGPNDAKAALAGGALADCPGDLATCNADLATCNSDLVVAPACGNGTVDAGEDCDQANLNSKTRATEGFAGGTLTCSAGCTFDTSGCSAVRFIANGDGTVTDVQTGLMWEQKDALGGIHDWNNPNLWSATGTLPGGTTFTTFIGMLNNGASRDGMAISGCFADHCDWRLPTIAELMTIYDSSACGAGVCIDAVFRPTSVAGRYWSSTTVDSTPLDAWYVFFGTNRGAEFSAKTDGRFARAVRNAL